MIYTLKTIFLLGLLLLLSAAAAAQVSIGANIVGHDGVAPTPGFSCSMTMATLFGASVPGSNAPYSAVRESSSEQTLADGTHISETNLVEKIYRDSQGRTRSERPICHTKEFSDDPEALFVEIRDPVVGYAYVLDPQGHIAHRYVLRTHEAGERATLGTEKVATLQTLSVGGLSSPTPPPEDIPSPSSPSGARVTHPGEESIGSETMEGLVVEGTRRTHTIPVGEMGNDRPLTTVNETWTSPALKLVIMTKVSDPRFGERTNRLTNLDTSEPSPLLFQAPPDYKVVDETEPVRITYRKP
jgi:hypothetical protein